MYIVGMNSKERKVLEGGPLETLFSGNATAKIMDFLISSQEWDYSESDIARNSGVSIRTVQREISKLVESKLIKHARPVGNAKMYQLDKSTKTGQQIEKLAFSLAQIRIHKLTGKQATKKEVHERIIDVGSFGYRNKFSVEEPEKVLNA
jgi:predicted ArsR family transcriptional regulator